MDVLTVFIVELCLALLLSRTLVAHLRAFLRRAGNALRKPCPPRPAYRGQSSARTNPHSNAVQP